MNHTSSIDDLLVLLGQGDYEAVIEYAVTNKTSESSQIGIVQLQASLLRDIFKCQSYVANNKRHLLAHALKNINLSLIGKPVWLADPQLFSKGEKFTLQIVEGFVTLIDTLIKHGFYEFAWSLVSSLEEILSTPQIRLAHEKLKKLIVDYEASKRFNIDEVELIARVQETRKTLERVERLQSESPYSSDLKLLVEKAKRDYLRSLEARDREVAIAHVKLRETQRRDQHGESRHFANIILGFDPDNMIAKAAKAEAVYFQKHSKPINGRQQPNNVLDISSSEVKQIDDLISRSTDIHYLYVSSNGLSGLPPTLSLLKNIIEIDASNNQINELPKSMFEFINLQTLDLSLNEFEKFPDVVLELHKLENLNFRFNKLTSLPPKIKNLKLKTLDIRNNFLPIPPEILEITNEPNVILDYYFTQTLKPLNEAKIVLVGQGSVGKTSLVRRLLNNEFRQIETKTEGISIDFWKVKNKVPLDHRYDEIKVNVWDFGGQEIMHATHQFFLTKRSLYLLVLDSRLTQEENRIEYWLKIIQSFGGESPVLIVGNKIDQHPLDVDRTGLQKKYPNIVGILETSAATGAGIEELKAAITEQVNSLRHVRDLLPETWFTVKTKLEGLGRESNFITHDKYLELCAENEVSDETSQRTLIGFLHDLGVVLHFQDDPRLEALGILNPQWVTNGVYKILNSHELFQNKGVLTVSMLDEILNLPEYPRGKRLFIVDMMKKFELCYDIEPDKTFLVPDLLPKDEPAELVFNGVPAFEYAYPVLPSSVITRFIVRMNQKIEDGLVWRTGVVLKIGENKALVKADIEDRKITIAIDGQEHTRRDILSAIRTHLDDIHNSIKGLNPEKFVPVPGADKAKPLPYSYLLMLEAKGIEILPVQDGDRLVEVNIRQVLSGVESESQRRQNAGNVYNIVGDINVREGDFIGGDKSISAGDRSVVVGGNMSGNLISGNYNKINSAEINPELKDTLLQLGEAVDAMLKKLPAEQATEVAEDFGKLADEAVKSKPNKRWYSVSIEGLIKAAENLDKLGTPVISLSKKVLSLLTGGVVK